MLTACLLRPLCLLCLGAGAGGTGGGTPRPLGRWRWTHPRRGTTTRWVVPPVPPPFPTPHTAAPVTSALPGADRCTAPPPPGALPAGHRHRAQGCLLPRLCLHVSHTRPPAPAPAPAPAPVPALFPAAAAAAWAGVRPRRAPPARRPPACAAGQGPGWQRGSLIAELRRPVAHPGLACLLFNCYSPPSHPPASPLLPRPGLARLLPPTQPSPPPPHARPLQRRPRTRRVRLQLRPRLPRAGAGLG